jgi:hypothetical protein
MTMPVSLYMIVAPGTHVSTNPEYAPLFEDPNHQTPALTAVTVIGNQTTFHGTYSTSAFTATAFVTNGNYQDLVAKIAAGTVRVDITYDSSVAGNTKPLLSEPVYTNVTPEMYFHPIQHIAHSIGALEHRLESGVSAELRDDIKFIRKAVEELVSRR